MSFKRRKLLIVLVSAFLVVGGCVWLLPKSPRYNLTPHVKHLVNMAPVESLSVEVLKKDTGERVAISKTGATGTAIFVLPAGNYSCRPIGDWSGKAEINLESDSELELKVLPVYR